MKTITTRELVHHAAEVRRSLERGEVFQWTQRGRVVAVLQPVVAELPPIDWTARAREAGSVAREAGSPSQMLLDDRGE